MNLLVNDNFKLNHAQVDQVLDIQGQRVVVQEISQTKDETLITISNLTCMFKE